MSEGAELPHCGLRRRYLVSQRSLSCVELCKQDPWRAESVAEAPKLDGGCLPFSQLLKDLPSLEHISLKTLSGLGTCSEAVPVAPQVCRALCRGGAGACSPRLPLSCCCLAFQVQGSGTA